MDFNQALRILLYQLADDDLLIGHRASEWIGLVPHLEADVAYASIAQDELSHAFEFYQIAADGHQDRANLLAYARPSQERLNATLLELSNGPGSYLEEPHFDWVFTVVRHWIYDTFKSCRLERLIDSQYRPLADLSRKLIDEERYHLEHHRVWLSMLLTSPISAPRTRAEIQRVLSLSDDLVFMSSWQTAWGAWGLLPNADSLASDWRTRIQAFLDPWEISLNQSTSLTPTLNGRLGHHTAALEEALQTMNVVSGGTVHASW